MIFLYKYVIFSLDCSNRDLTIYQLRALYCLKIELMPHTNPNRISIRIEVKPTILKAHFEKPLIN
jgi:hypothetical protein